MDKGLKELIDKLNKSKDPFVIKDKKLKREVAEICLKFVRKTSNEKESIKDTAYLIVGNFMPYTFEDKLDEVMNLAGELELSEAQISEGVLKSWTKMKNMLEKYVSKK